MKSDEWDKCEVFTASNGEAGIRYAVSDRDGVTFEISMHDDTIQSMIPRTYWLPVFTAPANNAMIERIDGRLNVLCGLGKPTDPMGNLVLMRVASRPGFLPDRMMRIAAQIQATLTGFGIRPDKRMIDAIRNS